MDNKLIRKVASKQKLLALYTKELSNNNQATELIKEYKSLINQLLKSDKPTEIEHKIDHIDRELKNIFDSYRLITNKIGSAAVDTDY